MAHQEKVGDGNRENNLRGMPPQLRAEVEHQHDSDGASHANSGAHEAQLVEDHRPAKRAARAKMLSWHGAVRASYATAACNLAPECPPVLW